MFATSSTTFTITPETSTTVVLEPTIGPIYLANTEPIGAKVCGRFCRRLAGAKQGKTAVVGEWRQAVDFDCVVAVRRTTALGLVTGVFELPLTILSLSCGTGLGSSRNTQQLDSLLITHFAVDGLKSVRVEQLVSRQYSMLKASPIETHSLYAWQSP